MPADRNMQASDRDESSLESLLSNLGQDVVQVVASPNGLDVPVGELVIYDPTEHSSITVGAIVLAVGVQPETPQSETMLKAAARARAAAVLFKGRDEVAALAGDSASFGVALLSVPEEMTWTQLHGRAPAALRRERGVARAAAPAR